MSLVGKFLDSHLTQLTNMVIYTYQKKSLEGQAMKRIPAYIINDLEKLNKHLDKVADLAQDIETWVEKNTDKDSYDFFCENHLDNPYEFDIKYTKAELERIASRNSTR